MERSGAAAAAAGATVVVFDTEEPDVVLPGVAREDGCVLAVRGWDCFGDIVVSKTKDHVEQSQEDGKQEITNFDQFNDETDILNTSAFKDRST